MVVYQWRTVAGEGELVSYRMCVCVFVCVCVGGGGGGWGGLWLICIAEFYGELVHVLYSPRICLRILSALLTSFTPSPFKYKKESAKKFIF